MGLNIAGVYIFDHQQLQKFIGSDDAELLSKITTHLKQSGSMADLESTVPDLGGGIPVQEYLTDLSKDSYRYPDQAYFYRYVLQPIIEYYGEPQINFGNDVDTFVHSELYPSGDEEIYTLPDSNEFPAVNIIAPKQIPAELNRIAQLGSSKYFTDKEIAESKQKFIDLYEEAQEEQKSICFYLY